MRDAKMLRETFTSRDDFSLAQYLRIMPSPDLRAQVRFTPLAADRARREWWLGIVDEKITEAGHVLTLASVSWEGLAGWLLSFGQEAMVLGPTALRKMLVQTARETAAHHAKTPARKVS
jgi:predicted DNA-binding transcriptional regulator YafY